MSLRCSSRRLGDAGSPLCAVEPAPVVEQFVEQFVELGFGVHVKDDFGWSAAANPAVGDGLATL